jgi:hypothetical protein
VVKAFMLGAVVGGAAVWLWGGRLRGALDGQLRAVCDGLVELVDAATDSLTAWRHRLDAVGRGAPAGADGRLASARGRPESPGNVAASLE